MARRLDELNAYWLPHNFDRRGRIYHVSDFGHHNTDHMRAMLLFAEQDPVGDDECEHWLKLSAGEPLRQRVDKESLDRSSGMGRRKRGGHPRSRS